MVLRSTLALGLAVLVAASACGGRRAPAVLGQEVSGCAEAVAERAAATTAIDVAEKQAVERDRARAQQLQAIAAEGKHGVVSAADLGPCDDQSRRRGVAVDLADLRARYRVVIERTTARLSETAAQPVPVQPQRGGNRGRDKGGTKD